MKEKYPNVKYDLAYLENTTGGQAETVLKVKHLVDPDSSLIIYNIDTHFVSTRLKQKILTLKNKKIDGILGCSESNDENLSFVKLNQDGFVSQIKEKEKISNLASTGLYIFSNAKQFIETTEEIIQKNIKVKDEFFISGIYNTLLKSGKKFVVDVAEEFIPLGTPDDIKKFEE